MNKTTIIIGNSRRMSELKEIRRYYGKNREPYPDVE